MTGRDDVRLWMGTMTIWMSSTVTIAGLDKQESFVRKMRIGDKEFLLRFSSGVSERLLEPIPTTCIICGYHTALTKKK